MDREIGHDCGQPQVIVDKLLDELPCEARAQVEELGRKRVLVEQDGLRSALEAAEDQGRGLERCGFQARTSSPQSPRAATPSGGRLPYEGHVSVTAPVEQILPESIQ